MEKETFLTQGYKFFHWIRSSFMVFVDLVELRATKATEVSGLIKVEYMNYKQSCVEK